jgi:hypothetical protein
VVVLEHTAAVVEERDRRAVMIRMAAMVEPLVVEEEELTDTEIVAREAMAVFMFHLHFHLTLE